MQHRVTRRQPNISEKHTAPIFMTEEYAKQEMSRSSWLAELLLVSCLVYSSTFKMGGGIRCSKTSGSLQVKWGYGPEDCTLLVITLTKQTGSSSSDSELYLGDDWVRSWLGQLS
jgi:hypothetical protein